MPFPSRYVDELINRLTVRYGVAFMRQYGDADPSIIKADWCDVLDGWEKRPEDIAWALAHLPDTPVNALTFRTLIRAAPRTETVALPPPKADPKTIAKVIDAAKSEAAAQSAHLTEAQKVIDALIKRAETGRLGIAQRGFLRTCRKALREDDPRQAVLDRLLA